MVRSNLTRGLECPPEPVFPWIMHRFNPSVPPMRPILLMRDPAAMASAAPVMWFNQCRTCWGWVDDPRHS